MMAQDEHVSFLSLPPELMLQVTNHLHNIEDHMNLSSTCRSIRSSLALTSPQTILHLAAAQRDIFFRPSPEFLVAAVAKQLGDWASQSSSNAATLRASCQDGMAGLLDLALTTAACGLTMPQLRSLHLLRFSTINPVVDLIDKCIGQQWYRVENFWDGGVDDAYTINADPGLAFFHLSIYGDLFGPALARYVESMGDASTLLPAATAETRFEYVKYCVPDWACYCCMDGARDIVGPDGQVDSRRDVKATGPYKVFEGGRHRRDEAGGRFEAAQNQISLRCLIESTRWNNFWGPVRAAIGTDFSSVRYYDTEESQDQERLWRAVIMYQGLEGLQMLRPLSGDGVGVTFKEKWEEKLKMWRRMVVNMGGTPLTARWKPGRVQVGRVSTNEWPDLRDDLWCMTSGYVGGT